MHFLEPLERVTPIVLSLWLLALTVILCAGVLGCSRAWCYLRRQRRDQHRLIGTLRIKQMLKRLGLSPGSYLSRETAPRVEIQLLRCHRCPRPDACDAYLQGGEALSPVEFCPNYKELYALSNQQQF